jgi:hypothetical protein
MGAHFSSGIIDWRRSFAARMGARSAPAHVGSAERDARRNRSALDTGTAAWLVAVPTAAIVIVGIVVVGPPLGELLFPASHLRYWPQVTVGVLPEPTEHARFLIALTAPLLLTALTVLLVRRAWLASPRAAILARATEVLGVLVVVACFVAQRLQAPQNYTGDLRPVVYFTLPSIVVAIAIAAAIAGGLRSSSVRKRAARWFAESRARRVGVALVVIVALVVALLPAFNTDGSIAEAFEAVSYHLQFTYDETMAVVDGRSPIGDFATQYAALWPYLLAWAMSLLGSSLAVFTGLMATLTGVALLALYDILRRLTRSSVAALLLFLPLLATCGFRLHGPAVNRFSLVNYFGVMPLRYAGPFLVAWLVARHLDGARPRRTWPLFLAAGLAILNNIDFGLPALGATVAALAWTRSRPEARGLRSQLLEGAAGLAAALALVTTLLLARTGSLPDLSLLVRYARVFAIGGFSMLPIKPLVGIDIVIFLTHVAAVGVATVRALRGERDRVLTGMLAWSGIFGLGAGSYYVGHSLSELLIYTFPCWALSITLLTLLTIRGLAGTLRRPAPAELACLVGFGLLVCSLAQTPVPWQQLQRIALHSPPSFARPVGEPFVAQHTVPGESVVIMAELGHRIAASLKLHDVELYSGAKSIFTLEQVEESVAALRAAGGRKVFVERVSAYESFASVLRANYQLRAAEEWMQLWVAR